MKKRFLVFVLAIFMVFTSVFPALAADPSVPLVFDSSGGGVINTSYINDGSRTTGSCTIGSGQFVQLNSGTVGTINMSQFFIYCTGSWNVQFYDSSFVSLYVTSGVDSMNVSIVESGVRYIKITSASTVSIQDFSVNGIVQPVPSVPAIVSGLSTIPNSIKSGILSWSSLVAYPVVTGYNVYLDGVKVSNNQIGLSYAYFLSTGSHSFRVSAVNSMGEGVSSVSSVVNVSVPLQVSGVSVSGSGGSGSVNWTPSPASDYITGYDVYMDGSVVSANQTSVGYSFTGVGAGSHLFTVSAVNAVGVGSVSSGSAYIVLGVPGKITGVTVSGSGANNGVITWTTSPSSDQIINYKLYDSSTLLSSPVINSYSFSGLSNGLHPFSVSAVNSAGEGLKSDVLSYTVIAVPSVSAVLSTSSVTYNGVSLTWTAVSGATNYRVYSKIGSGAYTLLGTQSGLTYTVSSLSPTTSYSFKVVCTNISGDGPDSNIATINTLVAPVLPPTAPTGIKTVLIGGQSVTLSWDASPANQNVTSYKVYNNGVLVSPTPVGTTAKFTNLSKSTLYTFTVKAVNSGGDSPVATVTATTLAVNNSNDGAFTGQSLPLGVKLADIFGGVLVFLGSLWPIIALGIAVAVAFGLARRLNFFGKKAGSGGTGGNGEKTESFSDRAMAVLGGRVRKGSGDKEYYGNVKIHEKGKIKLARRSTHKTMGGKRLSRRSVEFGVKRVRTVNQKNQIARRKARHKAPELTGFDKMRFVLTGAKPRRIQQKRQVRGKLDKLTRSNKSSLASRKQAYKKRTSKPIQARRKNVDNGYRTPRPKMSILSTYSIARRKGLK